MFQLGLSKDTFTERPLGVADPRNHNDQFKRPQSGCTYESRTLPAMGTKGARRPKSGDARTKFLGKPSDCRVEEEKVFTVPRNLARRPWSAIDPDSSSLSLSESFRSHLSGQRPVWKNNQVAAQVSAGGVSSRPQVAAPVSAGGVSSRPQVAAPVSAGGGEEAVSRRHTQPVATKFFPQRGQSTPNSSHVSNLAASMKSLPDSALPTYTQANTNNSITSSGLHHSLIHIPNEYGIYGNQDSITDETAYTPSVLSQGGVTPKAGRLENQRSRSQGHLAQPRCQQQPAGGSSSVSSASPAQYRLNLALAQSLVDHTYQQPQPGQHSQQPDPHSYQSEPCSPHASLLSGEGSLRESQRPVSCVLSGDRPASARVVAESGDMEWRPRSASIGPHSAVAPLTPTQAPHPDPPRENVWDESTMEASMLSVSDLGGGRRKEMRRKKKDRQKKHDDSLTDAVRKKTGIKDSIKNIFFKKR